MKKITTSNIVLGIIAAEVLFLTAQAIAERPSAPADDSPPDSRPRPKNKVGDSLLARAWHQASTMLKRFFSDPLTDFPDTARRGWQQKGSNRLRNVQNRESGGGHKGERFRGHDRQSVESQEDGNDTGTDAQRNLPGFAEKMNDPVWAGMLAANHGNAALADAARAVPMPKSARFVERLDRNPYIGKGMKDRSRNRY